MRLAGKTALITGGSSGIGLATAKLFAQEGARVAITGRDAAKLEAARLEVGRLEVGRLEVGRLEVGRLDVGRGAIGGDAVAVAADVGDLASLEAGIGQAAAALGGFDIVFANAGISADTTLGTADPATFARVIGTNLTGAFFTVQFALPHLRDGGSVIFNGSVIATLGVPGYAAYAASKGGVSAMARVLASELAPRAIRVNTVVPGATRTPIWDRTAALVGSHAALEARLASGIPLARLGEAEELAKAVLFLASDDAANITATELVVDGGTIGAPAGSPRARA